MKRAFPAFILMVLFVLSILSLPAFGQEATVLKEGIRQYNQENYEEAIVVLTRAEAEDPASAEAAFYLGMAYRQTNDILSAYRQFEKAVGLKPLSDNAILELIEASTLLGKLDVAKKWIAVAEEHKVYPARIAFLKGTALVKETRYEEAVSSFEKAKRLDPAYTQSADFQIGVCYLNQKKYARAKDLFQSAVTQDPLSDMATYARRYQDAAEQWRFLERPLRFTVTSMGQFDSNYRILGEPSDQAPASYNSNLEGTDKQGFATLNAVRLDYVPVLPAPFVFNAGYTALSSVHQRYGTDNDTFANSLTMAPGVNFESFAVNLVANYTHNLKREPAYSRYSEAGSAGPLVRYLLGKSHILEVSSYFVRKNFFAAVTTPDENRTSTGLDSSVGWVWLFRERALFNLKLGYSYENADGRNFDNKGYRVSTNLIYPLLDNLRLQLSGDFFRQEYKNENVLFDNTVRQDRSYTGTVGLTWTISRHLDVIAQYMYSRVNSNIYTYDYARYVGSLGVEFKF